MATLQATIQPSASPRSTRLAQWIERHQLIALVILWCYWIDNLTGRVNLTLHAVFL